MQEASTETMGSPRNSLYVMLSGLSTSPYTRRTGSSSWAAAASTWAPRARRISAGNMAFLNYITAVFTKMWWMRARPRALVAGPWNRLHHL